jgi:hypothetical protein
MQESQLEICCHVHYCLRNSFWHYSNEDFYDFVCDYVADCDDDDVDVFLVVAGVDFYDIVYPKCVSPPNAPVYVYILLMSSYYFNPKA